MFHESALADGADLLAGLARRKLTTDPEHT
jgi:hypothetical protein